MKNIRKTVSLLLAFVMVIGVFAAIAPKAYAVDYAAYVRNKYTGDTTYYLDAWNAWNAAKNDSHAVFGLLADWDTGRRVVPDNANMTVELNGHIMTRRKSKWENDGEVIFVGKNATLTVYGGTVSDPASGSDIQHVEKAYVAKPDKEDFKREDVTFCGGMIHGGNSSNGAGGIHMKSSSRVNLYYVTVAGNRAEQTWNMDGYGGGVMMDGTNCYLYMNHSTISYNYAYRDSIFSVMASSF